MDEQLSAETANANTCLACGARLNEATSNCWLCGTSIRDALPLGGKPVLIHSVAGAKKTGFSYSLSTLMLMATLAAICFGLLSTAPGLGIPICILLAPVLLRTAIVVRRREATGRAVSAGQKLGLILGSLVVAHVIAAVVTVAAIGTFCAVCLGIAASAPGSDEAAISFALLAAAVVTILLLVLMFRWVRARYRRDIQ